MPSTIPPLIRCSSAPRPSRSTSASAGSHNRRRSSVCEAGPARACPRQPARARPPWRRRRRQGGRARRPGFAHGRAATVTVIQRASNGCWHKRAGWALTPARWRGRRSRPRLTHRA
jgi:hypothetical protein